MRWMAAYLSILVFVPALALAAEPVGPPPRVIRLPTPADAQSAALADLKTLPPGEAVFQRYVWCQDQYYESKQLISLTVNYVSRASVIYRPALVKGGLVRIDLRRIAPRVEDLADYLALWEEFAFDPSFATIITRDAIEQEIKRGNTFTDVLEVGRKKVLVRCKPYVLDAQEHDSKWVSVIRLQGRHLDVKLASELELATGSLAPVVESRYFTFRALSTIKDKNNGNGTFTQVFGGLYYDLAGIRQAKAAGKKKATDEDLLFESLGIGDVDKGITAEKIFDATRSDQRVAVFRSRVTAKPRRVDLFPALSSRGGAGFLIVTHDIGRSDVDIATHPLANLENFKDKAREDIFTKANGLHGFALFDGQGKLQDEAPQDVVADRQTPAPHTTELAGAISCIRCHGDSDGLKPLSNDVLALRQRYIDVFGDLDPKNLNRTIPDTLDRMAGRYAGSPDKLLRRGREDYLEAILRATGPWKDSKDQTEVGKITSQAYERLFREWYYDPVDAYKALAEMGRDVPPKQAVTLFRELVGKDPSGLEDIRIGAMAVGLETTRTDWSLVQSFAATRLRANEAKLIKEPEFKEKP